MRNQRWVGVLLALLCAIWLIPAVFAQSSVTIDDAADVLDSSRIQSAARPLTNAGARVVVVTTDQGGEQYFDDWLNDNNIAKSGNDADLPADLIAIYISYEPRFSGIYYGRNFKTALSGEANGIRDNQLNAGLRANDPTRGVVDTLSAIGRTIDDPVGVRTETSSSSSGSSSGFMVIIAIIAIGALLFFVVPAFFKRRGQSRDQANVLEQTRQRYEQSRKAAGAAVADMGQQMRDAEEKQRFDAVSYPATQVQELAKRQRTVSAHFNEIQHKFDEIEERLEMNPQPSVLDFESAAGVYDDIRQQTQGLSGELSAMDALRKELDAIAAKAPAEVDRSKKF